MRPNHRGHFSRTADRRSTPPLSAAGGAPAVVGLKECGPVLPRPDAEESLSYFRRTSTARPQELHQEDCYCPSTGHFRRTACGPSTERATGGRVGGPSTVPPGDAAGSSGLVALNL